MNKSNPAYTDADGVVRHVCTNTPMPRGTLAPCGECKLYRTVEGHDGCLGTLPGAVMNACCGHGAPREAYIQYWNRSRLAGTDALRVFAEFGRGPERSDK